MAKRKASSSSTEVVKKKTTPPKAKSIKAKAPKSKKASSSSAGASSSKSRRRTSTKKRRVEEDAYLNDLETTLDDDEILRLQEKGELEDSDLEEELFADEVTAEEAEAEARRATRRAPVQAREAVVDQDCCLIGDPIPLEIAVQRWPRRYDRKGKGVIMRPEDEEMLVQAKRHYLKAQVDGTVFDLEDNAHVSSEEEAPPYIAKIIELFEDLDGNPYFRAQWYYRAEDTVIETVCPMREGKRIFLSEVQDDNPLGCLLNKLNIIRIKPNLDIDAKLASISECDYYFDMKYLVPFSTFIVPPEDPIVAGDSHSDLSSDEEVSKTENNEVTQVVETKRPEMTLLDLYSGCGAMSTGLCLGAKVHNTNLVTKWAVDFNPFACKSLQLNHPETKVRNETVEDFLTLLKEWKRICASYSLIESDETHPIIDEMKADYEDSAEDDEEEEEEEISGQEVFEVESVIGICYGDPKDNKKVGLYFKVSWKGYDARYDTWEPIQGLSNCYKAIGEFVRNGFKEKIVPMPGDADVVCGGPPCQGLSGFNRFRNKDKPLEDIKNRQLIVFMEVVDFLKPKFVLMENVVDLLKFALGYCGRYAVGRLVDMNYQTRMGMMAAGGYGLPQYRMRVFLWGALPTECLPQFPLPTHDAVQRGNIPRAFEMNTVAYSADQKVQLRDKLFLGDAISDLPAVENDERRDVMPYACMPQTDFQRFIRLARDAASGSGSELLTTLFDHRPLHLNADDFQRVCQIPKKKGANFRDLPGVTVNDDKKAELDPNFVRIYLDSGKPLVPDYAISYVRGTSLKPFGRLWYDETIGTVVTRAEPHNQIICHPYLDRVLTIRENARLQGFPDYYQLLGPIKQRYIQVGNAVAVPVARALGYSLALANEGGITQEHVFVLPAGFPEQQVTAAPPSVEMEED